MPSVARSTRGGDTRAEATGHRLGPGKVWALPGTQLARFPCLMCLPALASLESQFCTLKGPSLPAGSMGRKAASRLGFLGRTGCGDRGMERSLGWSVEALMATPRGPSSSPCPPAPLQLMTKDTSDSLSPETYGNFDNQVRGGGPC